MVRTVVGTHYGILSIEFKQHAEKQWRSLMFRMANIWKIRKGTVYILFIFSKCSKKNLNYYLT